MNQFILFILVFFSFSVVSAQSKLDLYNSAIGSSLLSSLNEEQKAQVTAQLVKNEKLDPGINYYFLKATFPNVEELKAEYNYRRVSSILIHNNYIKSWQETVKNEKPNNIVFQYLVEDPATELVISDFKELKDKPNLTVNTEIENIKNYYRYLFLAKYPSEKFDSSVNYADLLNNALDTFIDQLKLLADSLQTGQETSFKKPVLIRTLVMQSVLNSTGNQSKLELLESVHKHLISSFEKYYQIRGDGVFKNAELMTVNIVRLFQFSAGHSLILLGSNIEKQYNIPLLFNIGGDYGVPFKVNQEISYPRSYINGTIRFFPFRQIITDEIYRKSYMYLSLGIGTPFIKTNAKSSIDNKSVTSTGKNQANQEFVKIRNLDKTTNDVKFNSINTVGFRIPIIAIYEFITVEIGANYNVRLNYVESQFEYTTSLETTSGSTVIKNTIPGTPVKFSEAILNNSFTPNIYFKSELGYNLNTSINLDLDNSSFDVFWEF